MLVAVTIALVPCAACEAPVQEAPPPPDVFVTEVVTKDVPVYLELVGQTIGYQDVEIRARVEGVLESMNFREGSFVRKGSPLYEIDRKPLEATLAAAQADQATAEAALEKSNNDVTRYKPLAAKQAVSQQELDNALAAQDARKAELVKHDRVLSDELMEKDITHYTIRYSNVMGVRSDFIRWEQQQMAGRPGIEAVTYTLDES